MLVGRPDEIAPRLLGWQLKTRFGGQETAVRLTEVEAYGGSDDPASHAYRGRTGRNATMFLGAGHLYVYLSYGIHTPLNVVTGQVGEPGAVLLRAGEPIDGIPTMVARRGRTDHLADGPGKLATALGLGLGNDGDWLFDDVISLTPAEPPCHIEVTPRVGITRAVDRPWRFVAGTCP